MRFKALILCLFAAFPAMAADGLFVWNDPGAMAVKMVTLSPDNPAEATGMKALLPLRSISATMTAVSSDGTAIGICHEIQDGNEGDMELFGFDAKGRQKWDLHIGSFTDGLEAIIGPDARPNLGDRFFYSCKNGGATGKAGVLAFDIGLFRTGPNDEVIARIHINGKTGKIIAADLRAIGEKSTIKLGRNPFDRMEKASGDTVVYNPEAMFVFPDGGEGRVMWGTQPIRWKGEAVVNGHDFAWWLPPER